MRTALETSFQPKWPFLWKRPISLVKFRARTEFYLFSKQVFIIISQQYYIHAVIQFSKPSAIDANNIILSYWKTGEINWYIFYDTELLS